jgi:hypothetical protein
MIRIEPVPMSEQMIPETAKVFIDPSAPPEKRLMLARALVPMPSDELLLTLCFLSSDKSDAVARSARESIDKLPGTVLLDTVKNSDNPALLDFMARNYPRVTGLLPIIALNRATDDRTIAHIAGSASGPVLDQIAANHARMVRFPRIVEALYYNGETRMGTVSTVLENAVRLGINLSHIPGYQEIVESLFGAEAVKRVDGKKVDTAIPEPEPEPEPEPTAPVVPGMAMPPEVHASDDVDFMAALKAAAGGDPDLEEGLGLDDDDFVSLLHAAAAEAEAAAVEEIEDDEDGDRSAALWKKVGKMSVAQKVRAALLGSDAVRSILIRDSRRIVYMSVIKSPRMTEKEIVTYAKSRSINEEIIRTIAQNRDWTRMYPVRMALAGNPKCPPIIASSLLRTLIAKDVKFLAQSKDVPGYVARAAKQLMSSREAGHSR